MEREPTIWTAMVFFAFTICYIVLFFYIQYKSIARQRRKREKFKEEAIKDGRQVYAVLRKWDSVENTDDNGRHVDTSYFGYYTYTGIDGKEYKKKYRYGCAPPEQVVLYLDAHNPRKFYQEAEIYDGKHRAASTLLPLLAGLFIYYLLLRFVVLRAYM